MRRGHPALLARRRAARRWVRLGGGWSCMSTVHLSTHPTHPPTPLCPDQQSAPAGAAAVQPTAAKKKRAKVKARRTPAEQARLVGKKAGRPPKDQAVPWKEPWVVDLMQALKALCVCRKITEVVRALCRNAAADHAGSSSPLPAVRPHPPTNHPPHICALCRRRPPRSFRTSPAKRSATLPLASASCACCCTQQGWSQALVLRAKADGCLGPFPPFGMQAHGQGGQEGHEGGQEDALLDRPTNRPLTPELMGCHAACAHKPPAR